MLILIVLVHQYVKIGKREKNETKRLFSITFIGSSLGTLVGLFNMGKFMLISEVLRLAKKNLPEKIWICVAIDYCDISLKDKDKAKDYIRYLLGDCGTVLSWLMTKTYIPKHEITAKNLVIYRQKWIDHMIQELEKEGK